MFPCITSTYYSPKTGLLSDISEEGFKTLELCQAQIDFENKEDKAFKQELLTKYEEDLKNFVLDNDTSDREPVNPLTFHWRYDKKPHRYILDENGHHEITEHCIKDLFTLNASAKQIETVNYILNGILDPETFETVSQWVAMCFNKPNSDDLKLHAINQVLKGTELNQFAPQNGKTATGAISFAPTSTWAILIFLRLSITANTVLWFHRLAISPKKTNT